MSPSQENDLQLLLIRLDERTKNIKDDIDEMKANIKDMFNGIEIDYVKKIEFEPTRKIVYGVVTFILVAVLGFGVSTIFHTPVQDPAAIVTGKTPSPH